MKLLLDQNLPPLLVPRLAEVYPGSAHLTDFGLERAKDVEVWAHARATGLTLVSKDADFAELGVLRGHPPKVLWIRRGNCSTAEVEALLRNALPLIAAFARDETEGVLELW